MTNNNSGFKTKAYLDQQYLQLTRNQTVWQVSLAAATDIIVSTLSQCLQYENISVWATNEKHSGLHTVTQFSQTSSAINYQREWMFHNTPDFFARIADERTIVSDNVNSDPRLQELIYSVSQIGQGQVMFVALGFDNNILGLLQVKNLNHGLPWQEHEIHFIEDIGAFISQRISVERASFYAEQLSIYRDKADIVFNQDKNCLAIIDQYKIIDINNAWQRLLGGRRQYTLQKHFEQFSPALQPDGSSSKARAMQYIDQAKKINATPVPWQFLRNNGESIDVDLTFHAIKLAGQPRVLVTMSQSSAEKPQELLQSSQNKLLIQNENLKLINKLSDKLHACTEQNSVIDETMSILLDMASTEHIAIYLYEPNGPFLKLAKSHGFNENTIQSAGTLPVDNGLNSHALKTGKAIAISDFSEDSYIHPRVLAALTDIDIHSGVIIPLIYQHKPLGTLCLLYQDYHQFEASEHDTFETIGRQLSLSLANVQHIQKLDYQAHHDSLTKLPNRASLHRDFEQKMQQKPNRRVTLMLIDLDRFKDINDTLGHYVGDLLLKQISPRILACTREHQTLICRLGGDEFCVLIYDVMDNDDVLTLANAIINQLRQPINIESVLLEIDASIGIASCPQDGQDSHALLRCADVAMYQAKRRGGGALLYDRSNDIHTPERLALMAELGGAIRNDELILHFQPKIDLAKKRIIGFEALVRWQHPFSGLIYPDTFIPLAEVSDAIHHLTDRVLEMALKKQQDWRYQGYNYTIAVNLSVRNLVDDRWVVRIKQLLEQYRCDPAMLELEITETALMQDPEKAVSLLKQLSGLGVKLSIDDYGTGYSSLSYLRQLPINSLKIDRYFISEMLNNNHDEIIVKSTIALGHNLNLTVIAEGVEDQATLHKLQTLECDIAQGYYIAKPQNSQDIDRWISIHAEQYNG